MQRSVLFLCSLLFLSAAHAAGSATYRITGGSVNGNGGDGGGEITYAWRDGAVRVEMGQEGYMLMRDDKAYMVSQSGGETIVMDMSGMMAAMQDKATPPPGMVVESFSLTPTGESVTIAGIEGEVHTVRMVYADGGHANGQVVLSDSDLMAELARAMNAAGKSFRHKSDLMAEKILAQDQGMLMFQDGKGSVMELVVISRDAPPASAFELPAEPMQLPPGFGTRAPDGAAAE